MRNSSISFIHSPHPLAHQNFPFFPAHSYKSRTSPPPHPSPQPPYPSFPSLNIFSSLFPNFSPQFYPILPPQTQAPNQNYTKQHLIR